MTEAPASFSFDASTHEYRLGSQVIPGCTSVLASSGLVQFSFVNADVLERKGELGREVHKACHYHNLDKLIRCDERVAPHLDAWITFKQTCKFKLLSSEYQTVADIGGMHYGMQSDCNALINGSNTIVELKIGKVYAHHGVQLAGYAAGTPHPRFTNPLARFVARKRIVVELRASGKPKVHEFDDRSDYDVFCSALHIATWKRRFESSYRENNR
jgi:hypothetical protein